MKVNFGAYDKLFKFTIKRFQAATMSLGKEDVLLNIVDYEKRSQDREFLGWFPGSELSEPLLIFANSIITEK